MAQIDPTVTKRRKTQLKVLSETQKGVVQVQKFKQVLVLKTFTVIGAKGNIAISVEGKDARIE